MLQDTKKTLTKEVSAFISDSDLHLALIGLDLMQILVQWSMIKEVLENSIALAKSPLMQATAAAKL